MINPKLRSQLDKLNLEIERLLNEFPEEDIVLPPEPPILVAADKSLKDLQSLDPALMSMDLTFRSRALGQIKVPIKNDLS
jgi:hypothetical protein